MTLRAEQRCASSTQFFPKGLGAHRPVFPLTARPVPSLGQPPTEGGESRRPEREESQRAPGVGDVMDRYRFIGGLEARRLCALIPPTAGKTGSGDEGDKYGFIHVCFFLAVKQPF